MSLVLKLFEGESDFPESFRRAFSYYHENYYTEEGEEKTLFKCYVTNYIGSILK